MHTSNLNFIASTLAGVAQWIEQWIVNQKFMGSIPSLGHGPGLQARSPVGGMWEATTHWCFSPSLSPSHPLCLKINEILKKKKKAFIASFSLYLSFGEKNMFYLGLYVLEYKGL